MPPCTHSAFISIEPSFHICSALIPIEQELTSNAAGAKNDDVELTDNIMIKAKRKLYKSVTAVTNFVKRLPFGEKRFTVQIQTIKNCKTKIFTRMTAYTKLAMNFLEDGSWRGSK